MANLLTLLQGVGIDPRRASVADGGEYHSACPSCGDGSPRKPGDPHPNRFHVWPERPTKSGLCVGRFWCRQCDISGDTIEFVMKFEGLSFQAACDRLDIHLPDRTADSYYRRPETPVPPAAESFVPKIYSRPAEQWRRCAGNFLADCRQRLAGREEALGWLQQKRGIDAATAETYGLGFNESSKGGDRYRPRTLWGLPPKQGRGGQSKKLWLPAGWVIPMFDHDSGEVLQLRIRRRDDDIARFGQDIKYLPIDGSCHGTMVLHPDAEVFALVECGFDAIMLAALFGGRLGAVTTWNASARPDAAATRILHQCQAILDCLDFDKAGAKEHAWWDETFRRVIRWPTPVGKDPGEAYEAGVDVRKWILAGLPPGLAKRVSGDRVAELRSGESVPHDTQQLKSEADTDSRSAVEEDLPVVSWLKWCPICYGEKFLEAESGGYFCIKCNPMDKPGRIVLGKVPRGEYEVV